MQELIDLMKSHEKRGWNSMTYDFFFAQVKEMKLLEKEKEQIKNAYHKAGYLLTKKPYGVFVEEVAEYYNQNYEKISNNI